MYLSKSALLGLTLFAGVCHAQEKTTTSDNKAKLGNNIVSAIPFSVNNTGLSFGLSYERFLDDNGRFSVYLPVTYNQRPAAYHYHDYYDEKNLMAFLGFKYYTNHSSHAVRHAIGIMAGTINSYRHITSSQYNGGIVADKDIHATYPLTGFMIHNSLNVSLSRHLTYVWELDLGIGSEDRDRTENLETSSPLFLTQMTLGYRF